MLPASIVTVGTFDGVHAGHRAVISSLKEIAGQRNLSPVVVTFDRHPLETIAPERAPHYIIPNDLRDDILRSFGIDLHLIGFTEEVRNLTASRWFEIMKSRFNAQAVLMGYDNTLGSDGRGMDYARYRALGAEAGLEVMRAPELPGVSSSAIRRAIAAADFAAAEAMLLRPFSIRGTVVHGVHLAATLGFPTANIIPDRRQILPPAGSYAAIASLPDGSCRKAALNIGRRPTVAIHHNEMSVEAHIIDFKGNLYDKTISVRPVVRLRDEKRFDSIGLLADRIRRDIHDVRTLIPDSAVTAT